MQLHAERDSHIAVTCAVILTILQTENWWTLAYRLLEQTGYMHVDARIS